jgi:hypothetical protein
MNAEKIQGQRDEVNENIRHTDVGGFPKHLFNDFHFRRFNPGKGLICHFILICLMQPLFGFVEYRLMLIS